MNNKPSMSSVAEHAIKNLRLNFKSVSDAVETKDLELLKVLMIRCVRKLLYTETYEDEAHEAEYRFNEFRQANISTYLFSCIDFTLHNSRGFLCSGYDDSIFSFKFDNERKLLLCMIRFSSVLLKMKGRSFEKHPTLSLY